MPPGGDVVTAKLTKSPTCERSSPAAAGTRFAELRYSALESHVRVFTSLEGPHVPSVDDRLGVARRFGVRGAAACAARGSRLGSGRGGLGRPGAGSGAAAVARRRRRASAPAPPARDYLAEARASFGPENRAYNGARVVVRFVGPLYGILCGLLLLFTGLSARFRDIAEGLGHRRYVRVLVFFALYSHAMFVLRLPLSWYEEFALEHQFGLSTQTLSAAGCSTR